MPSEAAETTPLHLQDHLRGALVALAISLVSLWGAPILDFVGDPGGEGSAEGDGQPGAVRELAIWVNHHLRMPLYRPTAGLQKVFRIRQSWHLYRDGPGQVRRLEIWVDDQPVHRSEDRDLDWLEPELSNRRLRPMVETLVKDGKAKNVPGLSRYIVARVREDFPEAQSVELRALRGRFPGTELTEHHRITAQAPRWTLELP
jgi:hypothetical protein